MPLPLLLDTDPGIDDTLAILLALASPELALRGIVTVYGNAGLGAVTRNARAILDRAGARVPIAAGADQPLRRPLYTAADTHGSSGLGDAAVPPEVPVTPDPDALFARLAAEPEPVALVTLGPLTNLAHALARDASLVRRRVRIHVAMAGTLRARGTQTRASEFNVWCDPEAADRVLRAGLGTRWVGLDVTRQLSFLAAEVERLDRDPLECWLRDALRQYVRFHRAREGFDGCVVNDPLAVAVLLLPDAIGWETLPIRIDLDEGERRGCTGPDPSGVPASFAVSVDVPAVRRLLDRRVFRRDTTLETSA